MKNKKIFPESFLVFQVPPVGGLDDLGGVDHPVAAELPEVKEYLAEVPQDKLDKANEVILILESYLSENLTSTKIIDESNPNVADFVEWANSLFDDSDPSINPSKIVAVSHIDKILRIFYADSSKNISLESDHPVYKAIFYKEKPIPIPAPKDTPSIQTAAEAEKLSARSEALQSHKSALDEFALKVVPSMGAAIRERQVMPFDWRLDSNQNVLAMWKDWEKLRMPTQTPFYQDLLKTFQRPFNNLAGPNQGPAIRADSKVFARYRNPFLKENADWLLANDAEYMRAVNFFSSVRKMMVERVESEANIDKLMAEQNSDPVFRNVTETLSNVGRDAARAFRERDYGSLALYGVGVYSLFHVFQKLKGAGKGQYWNYMLYAAAGYSGYHILKRGGVDLGKLAGVEHGYADVKGTVYEHMFNTGIDKEGALDAGLLLAISRISVKDMHDAYKKHEDGPYIHPDQFPYAFHELIGHRPLDMRNPKTAAQKFYVQTAKKLYILMGQTIELYERIPGPKKSFYDEWINTRETKTFSDLGFFLSLYYNRQKRRRFFEVGDNLGEARKDFQALDGKIHFTLDKLDAAGNVRGTMMGAPVIFLKSADGESYDVKFYEESNPESPGRPFATIPLKDGPVLKQQVIIARQAIETKMLKLLTPLKLSGGKALDLQWDGVKWWADINMPGIENIGLKGGLTTVHFRPLENGEGIEVIYKGMSMPINWLIEQSHPYKAPLVHELVYSNDDYREVLLPFVRKGQLKLMNADLDNKRFELRIANIPSNLTVFIRTIEEPPGSGNVVRKYLIDGDSMRHVLSRVDFANEYANGVENEPRVEEVFDNFRDILSGAPQSFVWYFIKNVPGWFTEATRADLLRGFNASNLTGSIPNNVTEALLEGRRQILREKLKASIRGKSTFAQVREVRNGVYDTALADLAVLTTKFDRSNLEKIRNGRDWDEVDFESEVLGPLSKIGGISEFYKNELRIFTDEMYGVLFKKDDMREKGHQIASSMQGVFAFYTGNLDLPGSALDNPDRSLAMKDLPPGDPRTQEKEIAQKAIMARLYIQKVRQQLISAAARKMDQLRTSVPPGEDRDFWGVKENFADYFKNHRADLLALDVSDNNPPIPFGKSNFIDYLEYKEIMDNNEISDSDKTARIAGRTPIFRGTDIPEDKLSDEELWKAVEHQTRLEKLYIEIFNHHVDILRTKYSEKLYFDAVLGYRNKYLKPRLMFSNRGEHRKKYLDFPFRGRQDKFNEMKEGFDTMDFRPPKFWPDFARLEQRMSLAGDGLNPTVQKQMIDTYVKQIIFDEIFNEANRDIYFTDISLWNKFKGSWRRFWLSN